MTLLNTRIGWQNHSNYSSPSRKILGQRPKIYRRHGVEKFELDFDPEHTTPARVFRACLPWRAMVVCPETDRKVRRRFLARRLYSFFQKMFLVSDNFSLFHTEFMNDWNWNSFTKISWFSVSNNKKFTLLKNISWNWLFRK